MIAFIQPAFLLPLLILPALWTVSLARRAAGQAAQRWSFWGSTGPRTLAFGALVCSLAGARIVLPAQELTIM